MQNPIKPIAIHLPQFYPFPENDSWWGKGFTEWTNVVAAKPKFKGHYQPHLPADLGFYDLRLEEARLEQIELAKRYGIYGFCYYHYWFHGKRILDEPINRMLENPKEDFPFMFCWANETWARRWTGQDKEILVEQLYSDEDHKDHINHLVTIFKDHRYIKVDNKPFICIYRAQQIPDIEKMAHLWNEECVKAGFDGIHLAYMMSEGYSVDPQTINFEASVEFKPDFHSNPPHIMDSYLKRALSKLNIRASAYAQNQVVDYRAFVEHQLKLRETDWKHYKGVTPMWDNSARRKVKNAFILKNSTPDDYGYWLKEVIKRSKEISSEFIFINAWNEWAEGNHLEPCKKWGLSYLEATKKALVDAEGY